MTQREIAAKMGVSQKRVSDLENGNLDVVQVDTLRRYVAGLGGTLEINAKLPQGTIQLARAVPALAPISHGCGCHVRLARTAWAAAPA